MYIREDTVTVTLSTLGAGSGYSTAMNGLIHGIKTTISKAVGANSKIIITGESTQKTILTVANPRTLGAYFYPRTPIHGTTGNALSSSGMSRELVALANERIKVNVTSSSGLDGETATVVLNVY